jgi:C4-dicarboxylate transporter DctQ subunit
MTVPAGRPGRAGGTPGPPRRAPLGRLLLGRLEELLGGLAFVGMTAIVFVNVVLRYAFNAPIPGADELATLGFTWAVFVGAAAAAGQRLHIGIEFIGNLFPARGRVVLGLAAVLLMAAFAALVGVYGTKLMLSGHFKRTPVLQWSYTWVYLAIPVGAALMLARLALIAADHVARLRRPGPPGLGAEVSRS